MRYYKRPKGEYQQSFKGGLYTPYATMKSAENDSFIWSIRPSRLYCNYGEGKCDFEKDNDIIVFEILEQTDDCYYLGKRFKLNDILERE